MIAGLLDDGFAVEARSVLQRTLDDLAQANEANGAGLPLLLGRPDDLEGS